MTVDESKKEFNSKLLLLHQESIIVNADYEKAVRMSNLTTTAIKCFEALKDRKIRSYSIHRKRWIRAIDQVLLQNRALRAKGPVERVLVTTPRKRPMSIAAAPSSSRPRPACRRPSVIVVDEDTDSEKCHSECSTAADDGNGEEIDVPFKSKSFLDTAESRSSARDRDTQAQLLRAELFLNNGKIFIFSPFHLQQFIKAINLSRILRHVNNAVSV